MLAFSSLLAAAAAELAAAPPAGVASARAAAAATARRRRRMTFLETLTRKIQVWDGWVALHRRSCHSRSTEAKQSEDERPRTGCRARPFNCHTPASVPSEMMPACPPAAELLHSGQQGACCPGGKIPEDQSTSASLGRGSGRCWLGACCSELLRHCWSSVALSFSFSALARLALGHHCAYARFHESLRPPAALRPELGGPQSTTPASPPPLHTWPACLSTCTPYFMQLALHSADQNVRLCFNPSSSPST